MISTVQQQAIMSKLQRYRPTFVGVFGSRARGEQRVDSDLDLLVELGAEVDLLELIGIEEELSETLGLKVDLVTTRALDAKLRAFVEKDVVRIDRAA
jgi:hypothetical protein